MKQVSRNVKTTCLLPAYYWTTKIKFFSRNLVTSKIQLNVPRKKLKELGNGKFKELKSLNDPDGLEVILNLMDDELNISSEVKVDTFKISLEDSTFDKINEIFGEENYKLF